MNKKMLMLATTAAMIEQFNKSNIEILLNMGYEVHVAGNFDKGNPISENRLHDFKQWLNQRGCKYYNICITRNPLDIGSLYKTIERICSICKDEKYCFIHCHTPIGAVVGRFVGHRTNIPVIYTAHGFHFFKGAPIKNWLLYYPVEKALSKWTNHLILINEEDYARAERSFSAKKNTLIPGIGIDLDVFKEKDVLKIQKLRDELKIKKNQIVFISIGELHPRKNHVVVLKALASLKDDEIVYIIAGKGPLEGRYNKIIKDNGLEQTVKLLGFRDDIVELLGVSDCCIHPSIREGLGIAPLEAMACGLPLISSYINGIKDYTEDGKTGICIKHPSSVRAMRKAIIKMKNDSDFRRYCTNNNLEIVKKYSSCNTDRIMAEVYKGIENEQYV